MGNGTASLEDKCFDVIVIGGGIYGITAARESALQGLSVCLLEKSDFAAATSANSLKIMHGGLRYLQNLDFRRMRESIRERRAMHRLAPHLVNPMPFVIPCYGYGLRGPEVLGSAMIANELISLDKNSGINRDNRIPAAKLVSRDALANLAPDLADPKHRGGALWHDGFVQNTERLSIEFLSDAVAAGATVRNYTRVTSLNFSRNVFQSVDAVDEITGHTYVVRSRIAINASGPWTDEVLGLTGLKSSLFRSSQAINLVTRRIIDSDQSIAIPYAQTFNDSQAFLDKKKQHFFIIPWKGHSLIGTRHLPWEGKPDEFRVSKHSVQLFLSEINQAYPSARLTPEDVYRVYGGVLPAHNVASDSSVQTLKKYKLVDHANSDGLQGLISMVGVKWTTARDVSEKAVAMALHKLNKARATNSALGILPSSAFRTFDSILQELVDRNKGRYDAGILIKLAQNYGTQSARLLRKAMSNEQLGKLIESDHNTPTLWVEIDHAMNSEWTRKLSDVILRRTELGSFSDPDSNALDACVSIAERTLGWSKQDARQKIDELQSELERVRFDAN